MFLDVILDALIDTLKLLPFLFLVYLLLEYLEHNAEEKTVNFVKSSGRFAPLVGSLFGIVPQCGFSAAASNLYAGGIIGRGTLIAIFLSTSDEMLPILISQNVEAGIIIKILLMKLVAGIIAGFLIELCEKWIRGGKKREVHDLCEQENCHCDEDGIFISALIHTGKIAAFLFAVSLVIGFVVAYTGLENIEGLILDQPVLGELVCGLIGLIPNCAASVIITQLYLKGAITGGAMLAGLLVGAGVGPLVLCRMNRDVKDNLISLGILYISGVIFALIVSFTGLL